MLKILNCILIVIVLNLVDLTKTNTLSKIIPFQKDYLKWTVKVLLILAFGWRMNYIGHFNNLIPVFSLMPGRAWASPQVYVPIWCHVFKGVISGSIALARAN